VTKVLNVKCASDACKEEFNYYSSKFRPFCNEKCKMVDLGHWFDESYTIEGRDNSVYIEDSEKIEQLMNDTNETY
jgi:endogenous inhibitor of DNA gyrase (YacG/DUF329 family)